MSHPVCSHDSECEYPEDIVDDEVTCDICQGTGKVEITRIYTQDDGSLVEEGTGSFKNCPVCNEDDD